LMQNFQSSFNYVTPLLEDHTLLGGMQLENMVLMLLQPFHTFSLTCCALHFFRVLVIVLFCLSLQTLFILPNLTASYSKKIMIIFKRRSSNSSENNLDVLKKRKYHNTEPHILFLSLSYIQNPSR
jgi:hypothetical protein